MSILKMLSNNELNLFTLHFNEKKKKYKNKQLLRKKNLQKENRTYVLTPVVNGILHIA